MGKGGIAKLQGRLDSNNDGPTILLSTRSKETRGSILNDHYIQMFEIDNVLSRELYWPSLAPTALPKNGKEKTEDAN